jgi:hypothetical protein
MGGVPEVSVRRNGWFLCGVEPGPTCFFSNQHKLEGPLINCLKVRHNADLLSAVLVSPKAYGDFLPA